MVPSAVCQSCLPVLLVLDLSILRRAAKPVGGMMQGGMGTMRQQLKIFEPIIHPITVDVVDVVFGWYLSIGLFPDPPMFLH